MKLLAESLLEGRLELGDIGFLQALGRDDLFAACQGFFVAGEVLGHFGDRLFAEFEGLLDDGAVDVAGRNAFEGFVVFIEANDLHLAGLAGGADGVEDGGAVVVVESDEGGDVRVFHECVLGVFLGADGVGVVGADVDDFHFRAFEFLLDATEALLRVFRIGVTDENHDLAAIREGLLDQFAGFYADGEVVGADVGDALAILRVAVVADEQGLLGDPIGESDLLLFRGAAGGRDAEIDLDVAELLLGGLGAGAGDGSEGGGVVADERELELLAGTGGGVFVTSSERESENRGG